MLLASCTTARPVEGVRDATVHAPGILDPASSEFHGQLLRRHNYDFNFCEKCHGNDLAGGKVGSSCLSCHPQNPKSCNTCHGTPPTTGAHQKHALGGVLGKTYDCNECHKKPVDWSEPDHIRTATGEIDPSPTELTFGPLARTSSTPGYRDGRCENVYCHGTSTPTWQAPGSVVCGSCHGVPPTGHPGGTCNTCHPRVADANGQLVNLTLHLDGKVSLGDDSGTCKACHANLSGAHNSHTQATHGLAAALSCSECHVVPTEVGSPGHLHPDGLARVFPTGGVGSAASAYAALPSYDTTNKKCSDVACHGGGQKLSADQSPNIQRSPTWTATGAYLCGSCHGLPPKDGIHDGKWQLSDCASCHPQTMDDTGQLKPAAHANGVIDVR